MVHTISLPDAANTPSAPVLYEAPLAAPGA
jgi:hypothetical protein